MALPTFNAAKHHIGLKTRGGATMLGFMLDSGYTKELQREAQGAQEFGGQTDLIGQVPSVARWTQEDFVGGMFAYTWGRDDAMFSDCTGFIPMPQSRSLQSCPPMFLKKALDPDTLTGYVSDRPKAMFMVGGAIFLAFDSVLVKYAIDTDTTTTVALPGSGPYDKFVFAEYDSTDQLIWSGNNIPSSTPGIRRTKLDLSDPSVDHFYPGPSGTSGQSMFGGTIFNQNVVCQIGRKIYVGDPPDNPSPTIAGNMTWTKIGRLPGRWWDSLPYNGMLYILINDGSFKSSIYAFDGSSLMPIVTFPFSFYAKCMTEYAGRIYVGGTGTDVNGGEHYAELYEVTGSSVRLVRSFSPETRNAFLGGQSGEWPRSFDDIAVFEGMLWMAQRGKKMIAYDITSDGFFGAAQIQNANLNVEKMVVGRGRLWAFCTDSNSDSGHGIYRIAQPADSVSAWNPTLVTSDFAYEPAMKKRWGKLRIMSRYGSCASIEYSTNGGDNWTSLSVTTSSSYGKVYYSDADLAAITPTEHIRFRIKLTISGEAGDAKTYHRELVALTMSFVMLDSGKHGWSFTINGSDEIETRDAEYAEATTQAYNVVEVRDQLWAWAEDKTPLTYRDLNGTEYDTQIVGFREIQPLVGPNTTGGEMEALYQVTLLEV